MEKFNSEGARQSFHPLCFLHPWACSCCTKFAGSFINTLVFCDELQLWGQFLGPMSFLILSNVPSHGRGWNSLKLAWWRADNAISYFSWIKVYWNLLCFYSHTVQCATFYITNNALRLATSKERVSNDERNNWDALRSIVSTDVVKVLLAEFISLEVTSLLTKFMSGLLEDYSSHRQDCYLFAIWFTVWTLHRVPAVEVWM